MSTRPDYVQRMPWLPAVRHGCPPPPENFTPAPNGIVTSLLSPNDRASLRAMNVKLTEQAIQQCGALIGIRNQVDYGSQFCVALETFQEHGVTCDMLLDLAGKYDVAFPWSLQYGHVRQPFNQRLIRLPLAVVFPRTVVDVQDWVTLVHERGLSVSIRSGNNSYEGLSSINQVIIDLSFLTLDGEKQFEIDAATSTVRVTPGVRLGVLYEELAKEKFEFAGGQCAPVCVGGLVGTGGIGWLTRRYGWACDQLVEVECVLADGSLVKANADNEYCDLYQACKGAGAAGLCVMAILKLKIVPAACVLWYSVLFNVEGDGLENGPRILAEWQNLVTAPPNFSSMFTASSAPTRTISANGWYLDEPEDPKEPHREPDKKPRKEPQTAPQKLQEILDTFWLNQLPGVQRDVVIIELPGSKPDTVLEAANLGAALVPMPFLNQWKLKSAMSFRCLTEEELEPAFKYLEGAPTSDPLKFFGCINPWILGGASNSIDADTAVMPTREDAVMWMHAGAFWNDESLGEEALDWVRGLWATMENLLSKTAMYGCPDLELGSQLAETPNLDYVKRYWASPQHDFVQFLVDVKNRYDCDDVFRFAQSIPLSMEQDEMM